MKKFDSTAYILPEMEPFLQKVFEGYRIVLNNYGFDFSDDQEILDTIFEQALRNECAKYGYKG